MKMPAPSFHVTMGLRARESCVIGFRRVIHIEGHIPSLSEEALALYEQCYLDELGSEVHRNYEVVLISIDFI